MTTEITKQEMPETKKYAIRCSTDEQARECKDKGLKVASFAISDRVYTNDGYTIITYKEAVEKGLLGEVCVKNAPTEKEEVKEESKIEEPDQYNLGFERGRQIGYKEGWKSAMQEIDDIYIEQQKRKHLNK